MNIISKHCSLFVGNISSTFRSVSIMKAVPKPYRFFEFRLIEGEVRSFSMWFLPKEFTKLKILEDIWQNIHLFRQFHQSTESMFQPLFKGSKMLSCFFYLHVGVSPFQDEKKASKEKVGVNNWMSNMSGVFVGPLDCFHSKRISAIPFPLMRLYAHTFGHISMKQIPSGGSLLMNRACSFECFLFFVV